MLKLIALMRDWLVMAGSEELFDHYCGYTAADVVIAIDEMYPGGCGGWLLDFNNSSRSLDLLIVR